MVRLGELVMILDLHRQGLSVSAIARRTGLDRKAVRKYVESGLEPPAYGPRQPRLAKVSPFEPYLRERVAAYPDLTGSRLHREIRDLGYAGGTTMARDFLREVRPSAPAGFEVRFETPPGRQAQVDFAHFRTVFTDEPGTERVVWLFSLVLGHSRLLWAWFVPQQDLQTLLRCHAAAFEALGGVPGEVLYDRSAPCSCARTRTPATSSTTAPWFEFARPYGHLPKACQAYRAKTIATWRSVCEAAGGEPAEGARSSGRSAPSARTSSPPAASRTSATSTSSSASGWTRSPTPAPTPPRAAW